jgi:hypothetical protein
MRLRPVQRTRVPQSVAHLRARGHQMVRPAQSFRCHQRRPCSSPSHIVDRNGGKTDSRRALRACAGSRRSRRGRPVLQAPVLGAANIKRRNCPGVRGLLFEVPETPISAGMQLTQLHGEPKSTFVESVHARQIYPRLLSLADTSYPAVALDLRGPPGLA